jgi:hypothetical protein
LDIGVYVTLVEKFPVTTNLTAAIFRRIDGLPPFTAPVTD